ncbi:hypothetical protein GCM10023149_32150 [Mucilaginibacter gynuensis]|uniref:Glycosyltransferase involved in cell wall biosynthesis n=1 Tax=Mucilaginibacter gynuensis TaxID=1302236 RepID=A0ABP8GQD6_9SPHI
MSKKVMLLTLQTFSSTGGIQKMTRVLGHTLNIIAQQNQWKFTMFSAYDADTDLQTQYVPLCNFKGFNKNKAGFVKRSIAEGIRADVVILSHVNLAFVGLAIKLVNPKCDIWLIAHGIEIWRTLSPVKKTLLTACNKVLCVSRFTKEQLITLHKIDEHKCVVLNNIVDPLMPLPITFEKPQHLLDQYKLNADSRVLFTLTRLASTEQYKGYDSVIRSIAELKNDIPGIKYILAGKYDVYEKKRIDQLIKDTGTKQQIILTGFIDDATVPAHFLLADSFVLPSTKEGFGIVLVEAMACGLPVICGNADGAVDAVRDGELGVAIDPHDQEQLTRTIASHLAHPSTIAERQLLQQHCLYYFSQEGYISRLEKLLTEDDNNNG